MKKILPIIALILMMVLASCSGGGEESKSGSESSKEAAPAGTYEIVLKNGTDLTIREFSFGGSNLLSGELTAGAEQKVKVTGTKGEANLVFDGADAMTLHIFPFTDMQQATVLRDDKMVYLTYVNQKGALQNTKNDEAAYVPGQTETSSGEEESMYIPPVDGDPSMPDDNGGGCINDSGLFG